MGRENSIKTGTINKIPRNLTTNPTANIGNAPSLLPDSTYQYGIVVGVNPTTKEIVYDAIEDNMGVRKSGKAKPLYKNKIQLPDIGYIVPLLRGPDPNISTLDGQYVKTTYYLDPIGIWQTLQGNKIEKSILSSPLSEEVGIDLSRIIGAEIGIPNGQ